MLRPNVTNNDSILLDQTFALMGYRIFLISWASFLEGLPKFDISPPELAHLLE
jgi:hypothetical protein